MEHLISFSHSAFWFIILISIIVFIHEFGHYYIAKLCGVKIETFSIGFGKEVFGFNDKHGTRWKFSLFPLGGYVKMFGDADGSSKPDESIISQMSEKERRQCFHTKLLWQRALIVAAGPIANYILTIFVFTIMFATYGKPNTSAEVSQVLAQSAAEEAGIKIGDVIISINENKTKNFEEVRRIISLNVGTSVKLEIKRNDEIIFLDVLPKIVDTNDGFGGKIKVAQLGVSSNKIQYEKMGIFSAFIVGTVESYKLSISMLEAIWQLIIGDRSIKELGGPIKIAEYSGKSAEQGFASILWFMALISLNLGLVNLLPIPTLDGGHLFFYLMEAIKGKPLNDKIQHYSFRAGLILLLLLFVFVTFNDIKNIFVK